VGCVVVMAVALALSAIPGGRGAPSAA
jgi:hypothetical protein